MPKHETYLGDGVYAVFDGFHVVLDLRGQDSTTRIALDAEVREALRRFMDRYDKQEEVALPKDEGEQPFGWWDDENDTFREQR